MPPPSNKRIIVVSPKDSFFTMPHVRALERMGYECITFDNRSSALYSNNWMRRLMRLLPSLRILKKWSLDTTNKRLLRLVSSFEPWLVLSVKAENIYPKTIQAIRERGVITACFFIDFMDHWELIQRLATSYEYFFSQDHVVLERLRRELGLTNVFYMAHSAEPLADPCSHREYRYDIAFIGQYNSQQYPNREKYLQAVSDLGLHIWGTEGWASTKLAPYYHGRSLGDQRFEIYGHSKIVLDINWDLMPVEGLSNRPFEVCGSGALFMTDHVRADITRTYTIDKEVILFKDENELREKVQYYLSHNEERERIARAGYDRTVRDHTYDQRMKQLISTITHA